MEALEDEEVLEDKRRGGGAGWRRALRIVFLEEGEVKCEPDCLSVTLSNSVSKKKAGVPQFPRQIKIDVKTSQKRDLYKKNSSNSFIPLEKGNT